MGNTYVAGSNIFLSRMHGEGMPATLLGIPGGTPGRGAGETRPGIFAETRLGIAVGLPRC